MTFVIIIITVVIAPVICCFTSLWKLVKACFYNHVLLLLWREKVACNHQDWKNFGKEKKNLPTPTEEKTAHQRQSTPDPL